MESGPGTSRDGSGVVPAGSFETRADQRDLVFFSYNHDDRRWLEPIRSSIEPYVLDGKMKAWSDRHIDSGDRWHNEIQDAIARTRVAVLLLSQRFFASKYIRESELPKLIGDAERGLLVLICVPVGDVDLELLSQWKLTEHQFALGPEEPLSGRSGKRREQAVVKVATDVKDAYRRLGADAATIELPGDRRYHEVAPLAHIKDGASDPAAEGALFGVPDLDRQRYVERSEALTRLKQRVLEGRLRTTGVTSAPRSGRVGLHGMGGMGKTVLAQAFCQDAEVRKAFPDGIFWLTLGQEPNLLTEQSRLLQMIGAEPALLESIPQGLQLLRQRLKGKRALLVIDDLWQSEHFRPFDAVDAQGRLLITTRDASLLTLIGAAEEGLDRMDERQAESLIAEWAGLLLDDLPDEARCVAVLCGYLPLALALAGAQIHDGVRWSTLIDQLERGQIDFLDHAYGSVFDSLGRSVDALNESERARYLELAVFSEDARIPPQTIARLWQHTGGLKQAETEKLLGRLHRKALLKLMHSSSARHVSFHDLQHDFVRLRSASPWELSARLLDAYRATLPRAGTVTRWWDLPADEPYLWTRLCSHLLEAEHKTELEALLLNADWILAKLNACADVNELLADYDGLSDLADVSLVRRALQMSSHVIRLHPDQVGAQLFGRLGTSTSPSVVELCRRSRPELENLALVPLRPALSTPGPLALTFAGHADYVHGAVLLADGRRALSWSTDRTLKLWDLERGEILHTLSGHEDSVTGALLLPDGRRALSWSADRTLKLWDLERGEALHTLGGHEHYVDGAVLLADGRRALSWSTDRTLKLWDLERGETLHTLSGHEDYVHGALLLADGRRALSWSADRTLKLWDLERGEALHTLSGHDRSITGAVLLPDGRRALSWSDDRTLKLWDLERGETLHTLSGHEDYVHGALLLADGRRVLSWSHDRTLQLWDLERGETLHTLSGHEGSVDGAVLLPDGRRALSWSRDRTLKLWNLERGETLHTLGGHEHSVFGALLLADGRRALSWSADRTLVLWDLQKGLLIARYFADAVPSVVVFSESTGRVFMGDARGRIHLVRIR